MAISTFLGSRLTGPRQLKLVTRSSRATVRFLKWISRATWALNSKHSRWAYVACFPTLERKMEKQSRRYMDPGRPFKGIPLLSQSNKLLALFGKRLASQAHYR